MKKFLNSLYKFQKAFRHVFNNKPTLLSKKDYTLRYKLSLEELQEYKKACKDKNLIEIGDALSDRMFLLLGDYVAHGMQDLLIPMLEEVVKSNMSKLDSKGNPIINGQTKTADGKIIYNAELPVGKILKSNNYFKPNLRQFFYEN